MATDVKKRWNIQIIFYGVLRVNLHVNIVTSSRVGSYSISPCTGSALTDTVANSEEPGSALFA